MKLKKELEKTIKPWKVTRSRYILSDRWIKVRADDCVTSGGAKISPFYVIECANWVHMVVVNKKGQILISEQYRHGVGKVGYEIPCGSIDPKDKNPLEGAKRELMEETGYGGDFSFVGEMLPNPARNNNKMFVFLVTNPVKRFQPQEDPTEVISCKFIDEDKVWKMIDQGKFKQALCISSLVIALRKNKTK